ncbi:flavodoxin [Oscillospiraceae bacterium LCP25S3_E4]
MKIKRLFSIILMSVLIICVPTGCAANSNSGSAVQNSSTSSTAQDKDQTATDSSSKSATSEQNKNDKVSGGKTLVVYFSATGSTKAVAEKISDATNGDIFELVPQTPYTSEDLDWNNTESRVTKEHEDESKRDVALNSTSVDNWDSYDTVFIGYPIWWGIAAWPVNSFVKENDFSGKTVIPFCTSASSDIGDSGSLLKEMVGTGNWQSGQRFASNASDDDVKAWLGQLGY